MAAYGLKGSIVPFTRRAIGWWWVLTHLNSSALPGPDGGGACRKNKLHHVLTEYGMKQVRIYSISITEGETQNEEMNA